MRSKFLLSIIYVLFLVPVFVQAQQIGLINGDLEQWRRRQFRCCGRNVDLPQDWGIPEQSCGMNQNRFVFLETDSHNVHSGLYSAMLYSDTTFFNNVGVEPGILVYGGYPDPFDSSITIGQPIQNFGLPIDSNPIGLTFWLKMSHNAPDTFSYMYLFTRWDDANSREDTVAYYTKDIPDAQVPMDSWFSVTDSIHYLHAGKADTVRMIFYGGRSGNIALLTNTTWIDDISLYYETPQTSTAVAPEPVAGTFAIYPNPAGNTLHIRSAAAEAIPGDILEISDDLGRMVSQTTLRSALSTADVTGLAPGYYICRILDGEHRGLYQAKLSVVR